MPKFINVPVVINSVTADLVTQPYLLNLDNVLDITAVEDIPGACFVTMTRGTHTVLVSYKDLCAALASDDFVKGV